ncbi:MAG TPA: hypothetical protein DD001_17650 [Microcoleaceae bacterium UBA10368]|jgi:hypothetical protein|nr:hypothetical protein [Microcoleaceae cyanobacterium UBA10368]HCV31844.1 hypothetical protein [Microcoleaceae cyanobacterium UBA9251]
MTNIKPSMLDVHSEALKEVDEAYHEFLLIYKKDDQCVYGFVEGKDDPAFYRYLIKTQLPKEWSIKLIQSENKGKVLRSFQSFNWIDYSKNRICFFIDRDLQDFLNPPQQLETNIYITDGYSIENYILEDEILIEVLSDIYQITQLRLEEEESIKQILRENENIFFEAIMPLMGQILLWKRLGYKPNLNNLELAKIFSFSQAKLFPIERNILLQEAAKQIGCNLCEYHKITDAENEFRRHDSSRAMVRGKYVFWFFVKQCEAIWEAIKSLLPRLSKEKKRIECGVKNAMVIFAPRTRPPESLKEFVKQNYLSFINEVSNS